MHAKRQKEHEWLQRLVGEWTFASESDMGADKPAMRCEGEERVRSIGGLWIVAEGRSEMPEVGSAVMLLTLGYDPARERFVGSWIGSMMTNLWVYDGELDTSGKQLSLHTEGPDICNDPSKTAKFKEVIELISDNERTFTSHRLDDNGAWQPIMTARYKRRT